MQPTTRHMIGPERRSAILAKANLARYGLAKDSLDPRSVERNGLAGRFFIDTVDAGQFIAIRPALTGGFFAKARDRDDAIVDLVLREDYRRQFRLYAWSPERRAGKSNIRATVRKAADSVRRAKANLANAKWLAIVSNWVLQATRETAAGSVHLEARRILEYSRMRACMAGAYADWPGDRPMNDAWNKLQALDGLPPIPLNYPRR